MSQTLPRSNALTWLGLSLVGLGVVGLLLAAVRPADTTAIQPQTLVREGLTCQVLTVYDGDTIGCDINANGRIEKPVEEIRLLGIDTPEMHYSRKNKTHGKAEEADEPFAQEASALTVKLTQNKPVYLRFDEEDVDFYGRTLAYVYLTPTDSVSLCELLLQKGYARTLFIPPNLEMKRRFKAAEKAAKASKLGIWGQF